jgi:hypothetical protein
MQKLKFLAKIMLIITGENNSHEAHYTTFSTPLFLPPSHTKYSPHLLALTNPQSVFFSRLKMTNFTPTQNDRNNVTFIDVNMLNAQF